MPADRQTLRCLLRSSWPWVEFVQPHVVDNWISLAVLASFWRFSLTNFGRQIPACHQICNKAAVEICFRFTIPAEPPDVVKECFQYGILERKIYINNREFFFVISDRPEHLGFPWDLGGDVS